MNCVFTNSTVSAIMLGPICLACLAITPPIVDLDAKASSIITAQAQTDLLNALDLTRPELGPVAEAWKRRNAVLAQRELARYFRTRTSVHWNTDTAEPPTLTPQTRAVADAAVEGKLQGGLVPLIYSFSNEKIDWHFNATYHMPGQTPDNEWQWQLNRMSFWSDLAVAYRATRDERYAEAFVQELRSWIAQCPVPAHAENTTESSWRTIEAGIRASGSWMNAFYAFRHSSTMTDADLLAMIHAFLDHGRYLRNNHTSLNWLTMEMSGLYAVGAVFPEFSDAAEWRNFAANTLAVEAREQFLPDGAEMELSTGYQNVSIDNILSLADIAHWTGKAAELPPGYLAPLERAYEWQMDIVAPNRHLPYINDSWDIFLPDVLKKALVNFPNRSDFQWFASNGREGAPPPLTSVFLDRSGLAAMRSGWDMDANYLLFRVGPLGMGHQHQDSLGVNLWAYGRELIFNNDGGYYEESKWRQWAISALSHNTVVVDGMAQTRPINMKDAFHNPDLVSQGPINAHWQTNPTYDFASGTYAQGYGPDHRPIASQQRDILFLKPDLYIVADRLHPYDSLPHRFQARWQILTTHSQIDPSTRVFVTEDRGIANIAVVPLLGTNLQVTSVSAQEEPEIMGWDIHKRSGPQQVSATTLLHTLAASGSHVMLTLLVPLRPGEGNPIARVEPGKDGVSATAIFADGRQLIISCPGIFGISVQEILTNGKAGRAAAIQATGNAIR